MWGSKYCWRIVQPHGFIVSIREPDFLEFLYTLEGINSFVLMCIATRKNTIGALLRSLGIPAKPRVPSRVVSPALVHYTLFPVILTPFLSCGYNFSSQRMCAQPKCIHGMGRARKESSWRILLNKHYGMTEPIRSLS